jgi:hypothetical protein
MVLRCSNLRSIVIRIRDSSSMCVRLAVKFRVVSEVLVDRWWPIDL